MNEENRVYEEYHNAVNMTYSELLAWSKTPCSRKASLSREPITRNLRLLKKNKSEWTMRDVRDANKTISFIARHRGQKEGRNISEDCPYSKRFVALANWGYWSN